MKEVFCGFQNSGGADLRELVLFELQELSTLPKQIKELLSDMDLAQKIADRGYQCAKKKHTWGNRAVEIKTDILDDDGLMGCLRSYHM